MITVAGAGMFLVGELTERDGQRLRAASTAARQRNADNGEHEDPEAHFASLR